MKSSLWCFSFALMLLAGCETSSTPPSPTASSSSFGRFEGEVVAEWDDDGRNMTLRQPFAYIDPQNRMWLAPQGAVVNGASIPYGFWSIIGGPFEGQYRNASVVHDVGCHEMTAPWQDVHRMFYDACRCGGVDETRAKLMYYAVYHFGPRWEAVHETQVETTTTADGQIAQQEVAVPTVVRIDPPPPSPDEVAQATALITEENPAPAVIEQTNREVLRRRPHTAGYGSRGYATHPPGNSPPGQQYRERPAERQVWNDAQDWNRGLARNAPGYQASQGWSQPRVAVDPALSQQETAWAEGIVREHLARQTGEQRSADINVERTDRGYRAQVQYWHLNAQGQRVGNSVGSTLRLGRDGRVMEMINRY